jgi:hypothetical protein
MTRALLILAICALPAHAENKYEAELRRQLVQTQAALAEAKKDREALQANLAAATKAGAQLSGSITRLSAKQAAASVASQSVSDNATANASVAKQSADDSIQVAVDAARDAKKAAQEAKAQARESNHNNVALIIVQSFGFAVVIIGFIYKGFEHHWDQAEVIRKEGVAETLRQAAVQVAKNHGAQLTQIHTLVNSSLTAAKQDELDTRRSNLVLLQKTVDADRRSGEEPSKETLALIDATKIKIAELAAQLEDRKRQTEEAAQQLQVDLRKQEAP